MKKGRTWEKKETVRCEGGKVGGEGRKRKRRKEKDSDEEII